eukprot:107857-Amphidinium_carterae.1
MEKDKDLQQEVIPLPFLTGRAAHHCTAARDTKKLGCKARLHSQEPLAVGSSLQAFAMTTRMSCLMCQRHAVDQQSFLPVRLRTFT